MTIKKVEDYFAEISNDTKVRPASSKYKNGFKIPFDSGYRVPNPVFNLEQQMALMDADRNAAALDKTPDMYQQAVALDRPSPPDMYQQAVALDGKEPAAVPYTPQELPSWTIDNHLMEGDPRGTYGFDDISLEGTQGTAIPPFNPSFLNITAPSVDTRGERFAPNILRDTAGALVTTGNGNPIGLPNQSTGNAATGGKGGAGGK